MNHLLHPKIKPLHLVVLLALAVSAFVVRTQNFLHTPAWTIDERVYFVLGSQTSKNLFDYNTIFLADHLAEENPQHATLSEYFRQPLFKHPPVFPWLLALSFKIFGVTHLSPIIMPALFGSLLILLGYLYGRLFFNETVGMLTAFCLWLDPVNIICSQKIWMETSLSFWTLLTVFLFALGLRKNKDKFFILSGIASGLAVLTKYPGILGTLVVVLYALFLSPELFRKKKFLFGIALPLLMLMPWAIWNIFIFGFHPFQNFLQLHGSPVRIGILLLLALTPLAVTLILKKRAGLPKPNTSVEPIPEETTAPTLLDRIRPNIIIIYGILFFLALWPNIFNALYFKRFPFVSWQGGFFQHPLFYFGRFIEFSGVYLFAFIPFFLRRERTKDEILLYLTTLVLFIFYLTWGNYQSRYIMAVTPLLLAIAMNFITELFGKLRTVNNRALRISGMVGLAGLLLYFFLKTNYINFLISYPNDLCYF